MSEMRDIHWDQIGGRIRAWRQGQEPRVSLDQLGKMIAEKAHLPKAPSIAKLSRIESGKYRAVPEIVPALEEVTGIPADELRPDLAAMFKRKESVA